AQILPFDALAEPAALLEPGTLRVLYANRALLAAVPDAVGKLATFGDDRVAPERALGRVAPAVAANVEPAEVFELVAQATRELLEVDSAGVVRYEGPTHGRVMGQAGVDMPSRRFTLLGENTAAVTARTGQPSYVEDFAVLESEVA